MRQTEFSDDGFALKNDPPVTPLISGERDYNRFTPYEIPAFVKEREKQQPTAEEAKEAGDECVETAEFRIHQPKLVINVDHQTMDFQLRLESKSGVEDVHLRGTFDRSEAPWRSELNAVNQELLKKRKVQAVALCLTAHVCDVLGVNIYYVIDGKTSCRQLQSGVQGPRVAMSGDEVEEEDSEPQNDLEDEEIDSEAHAGSTTQQEDAVEDDSPKDDQAPPDSKNNVPDQHQATKKEPGRVKKKVQLVKDMTPEQIKDATIEYPGRIYIAPPTKKNPYRLEGLPEPIARTSKGVLSQAIGSHNYGRLQQATFLPFEGVGFVRQAFLLNPGLTADKDRTSAWGTLRAHEFIESLGEEYQKHVPGTRLMVTSVSQQTGALRPGTYPGSSHRTGLDIDVAYVLNIDTKGKRFHVVDKSGNVKPEFDVAKNWELAKSTLRARRNWMIVLFMDRAIKLRFCEFARKAGEPIDDPSSLAFQTLRTIAHWDGHTSHFHVRLYCPGNQGCQNTLVTLPIGNGCPQTN